MLINFEEVGIIRSENCSFFFKQLKCDRKIMQVDNALPLSQL